MPHNTYLSFYRLILCTMFGFVETVANKVIPVNIHQASFLIGLILVAKRLQLVRLLMSPKTSVSSTW